MARVAGLRPTCVVWHSTRNSDCGSSVLRAPVFEMAPHGSCSRAPKGCPTTMQPRWQPVLTVKFGWVPGSARSGTTGAPGHIGRGCDGCPMTLCAGSQSIGEGGAWFATAKGVGYIERQPDHTCKKARFYEDEIDKRHRRTEHEYVMAVRLPNAGDKSKWVQHDSDNDGLWTGMYGAGECFAYAATKDPAAKHRATKAFEALRFLSLVTQGGEHPAPSGFPARAILPVSGPDPNIHDSRDRDLRYAGSAGSPVESDESAVAEER